MEAATSRKWTTMRDPKGVRLREVRLYTSKVVPAQVGSPQGGRGHALFTWSPSTFPPVPNDKHISLSTRTKYEVRDKQQQSKVETLEKEKKSLQDEVTSTVNELTQV